ncbi:MAG TPA: class I SAM-dependent methyltransferase [Ktedonobacterales bacterium]|nr:class I SAM-dependent methyltransferase [Ktedonobacterales bacterium]
MTDDATDRTLREQIAYYRARAGEYDEWFLRQGRYDRGAEANAAWFDEVGALVRALDDFRPRGRVLELAAGTGLWTQRLAVYAETLTAVDASSEVLALNRARVGDRRAVSYVVADLFDWRPAGRYDTIFFSFWLSHVPPERLAGFFSSVRGALAEGGRVFFIDSLRTQTSTARDHELPDAADATTLTRRLNDGREYEIVKVFYTPGSLTTQLAALGWHADVHATGQYFLYGSAAPAGAHDA